jgi:hypothetical protein
MTTNLIEFILGLQGSPLAGAGALIIAFVVGSLIFVPRPPLCLAAD